jgi:DNA-binding NarL/FixJ family response regulator
VPSTSVQPSAGRTSGRGARAAPGGRRLARRVGAFGVAERANEEIAAAGARPRKVLQMGLDALTASKRRVAQLAAEGMSNKEIAQTLFVTIKTVRVH